MTQKEDAPSDVPPECVVELRYLEIAYKQDTGLIHPKDNTEVWSVFENNRIPVRLRMYTIQFFFLHEA